MTFDLSTIQLATPKNTSSVWSLKDYWGALKARSSIGRNRYSIKPGLYKLGNPDKSSDVLVTANYKLSFDKLRKQVQGLNVWILVLDTHGVNVWCAAGKGTFSTDEIIHQIEQNNLNAYVDHRRIIVPQLGAPGVAAHQVKAATGFNVKYGPVYARDIKKYINQRYKKTDAMRRIHFNMWDRFILTPVEIVNSLKYLILIVLCVFILSGLNADGYSFNEVLTEGTIVNIFIVGAYVSGTFLAPLLLPWLPFRSFGGKGLIIGALTYALIMFVYQLPWLNLFNLGMILLSLSISSFLTMNFTGSSTFTSLSGVQKEMKFYLPLQIILGGAGLIIFIISQFV